MKKRRNVKMRLLALCLTVSMLCVVLQVPVYAASAQAQETNMTMNGPENPVYDETTDTTKWSYIYFGNYPQTEVKGNSLTSAIKNASYNTDGDATVNGIKYRRISQTNVTYNCWSEDGVGDSQYRYFKWERIRWRVLQNDGTTLYVMADQGLDTQKYHNTETAVTWENCALRSWLNNTFYTTAFTLSERNAVVKQTLTNTNNPYYGTSAGSSTTDAVYTLSLSEVTNRQYGFCGDCTKRSKSRLLGRSDYARAMGAYCTNGADGRPNCTWWLRTPGSNTQQALFADTTGDVPKGGWTVLDGIRACVPALHIKLSSAEWRIAPENPVYDQSSDTTEWSYVYFGSYPQTEITGTDLTSQIVNASYDNQGDAWVGNKRYRRIRKIDANNGNNFGSEEYRYFKWEYIKWRVLQNDGETLYVMADQALDCKSYNEEAELVTWESCTLRNWLNNTFYNIAFTAEEQESCVGVRQTGGEKVSLLYLDDAQNADFGFGSSGLSKSRNLQMSDYAYRMGTGRNTESDYGEVDTWWLYVTGKSATRYGPCSCYGEIYDNTFSQKVEASTTAVVPTLRIDLSCVAIIDNSSESGTGGTIPINVNISYTRYIDGTVVGFTTAIAASGGNSSAYEYQWYYVDSGAVKHTKIAGATHRDYEMSTDSLTEDMGNRYYYCVVSDGSYSTVSNKLRCYPPLKITGEPQDYDVSAGHDASFRVNVVNAENAPYLTYQWYYAETSGGIGTKIDSGTVKNSLYGSEYVIKADEINDTMDGRYYYCVISNVWYSVTTQRAKLNLTTPMAIENVEDKEAYVGQEVTFCANVSGGYPSSYTYQWYTSSTRFSGYSRIAGAVESTYTIPSDEVTEKLNGHYYYCYVSNGYTKIDSNVAKLTVSKSEGSGESETKSSEVSESEVKETQRPTSETSETQKPGSSQTGTEPSSQKPVRPSETPDGTETGTESPQDSQTGESQEKATQQPETQQPTSEASETQRPGSETPETQQPSSETPETQQPASETSETQTQGSSQTGTEPSGQNPVQPDETPAEPDEPNNTPTVPDQITTEPDHTSGISGNTQPGAGGTQPDAGGTQADSQQAQKAKLSVPVLKVTLQSVNSVKLTWKKISGAKGYTVYRATSKKGKYSKLKSVTGTSYTDKKLKKGKTYYYKIEAYNGSTLSAKSAAASKKIIGKLSTPKQNIIKFNSSYTEFTVSWKPVKNAKKIEILLSTDNGAYKVWKTVSAGKGKAVYPRSSLKKGHRYSFAVRAYYEQDGKKICSSRSNSYAFSL